MKTEVTPKVSLQQHYYSELYSGSAADDDVVSEAVLASCLP